MRLLLVMLFVLPLFLGEAAGQQRIGNNFWSDGGTEVDLQTDGDDNLLPGVTYETSFNSADELFEVPSTAECGDGLDPENTSIGGKGTTPQSVLDEDSSWQTRCSEVFFIGDSLSMENNKTSIRRAYDTLKLYIESCAIQKGSFHAFSYLDGAVTDMDTANGRWLEYREWLKKVLYLNPDTVYYCAAFNSMMFTFNYLIPGKGYDYNGSIALIDYILQTDHCPEYTKYWLEGRQDTRQRQIEKWQDTVKDPVATPLDTAAISIDSIGFSILKGPQFGAVKNHTLQSIDLGGLRTSKNPFTDETTLETTISDAMMLRLEVFDVLGKQVYLENEFFSPGDVRWTLDGKLLPKGSLYARVSTISGGVKTVKLVKE